jgi:uncharacterized membrane protein
MEESRKFLLQSWVIGILLALDLAASLYLYSLVHTGFAFVSFFVTLFVLLVFALLPAIDPHRANYSRFSDTFRFVRLGVVLTLVVLHWLLILGYALGWQVSAETAVLTALGVLWIGIGNVMGRIKKQTWFFGTANPWTLSDEGVWTRTQRLGSRVWVIAGLVLIVGGIIGGRDGWILLVALVVVGALIPHVYSYFDYRKIHK